MPYLVCEKCGYYELQSGESPDDFAEECECGSKWVYYKKLEDFTDTPEKPSRVIKTFGKLYTEKKATQYNILMYAGIIIVIIGLLFLAIISIEKSLPFTVIFLVIGSFLSFEGSQQRKSWIKGAEGERIVAKHLYSLPEGYYVFNDVKILTIRGNIDHVVVGPTGIFALETKNYSGHYTINGEQWIYGKGRSKKLIRNDPGFQARKNAVGLNKFLSSKKIRAGLWIEPIVTMINPNITVDKTPENYNIVHPPDLTGFILKNRRKMSENTIKESAYLLREQCVEYSYFIT